jgi:hypothetical protein
MLELKNINGWCWKYSNLMKIKSFEGRGDNLAEIEI